MRDDIVRHEYVIKTEEWTEWLAERFMEWVVGAMVESMEIKLAEIVCDVPTPLVWLVYTCDALRCGNSRLLCEKGIWEADPFCSYQFISS